MGRGRFFLLLLATAGVASATSLALPTTASAQRIAKSKFDAESFTAEMRAGTGYAAGKEGSVDVTILAKGEFKINQQFPIKLKLGDAPEGVTYPKAVLKKEDGTWNEKNGGFKVPFIAAKAGTYTISGTVSLSVCNDKKCLMEKVPLDVQVTVQ